MADLLTLDDVMTNRSSCTATQRLSTERKTTDFDMSYYKDFKAKIFLVIVVFFSDVFESVWICFGISHNLLKSKIAILLKMT